MAKVSPYLTFAGNCEEAFRFYHSVLGGPELEFMRFGGVPDGEPTHDADPSKIMHVTLMLSEGNFLMGCDQPEAFGPVNMGNNFSVSLHPESEDEARRLFEGLSADGTVTMPLEVAFWGALFGMFVDKFGIAWMVNYQMPQA